VAKERNRPIANRQSAIANQQLLREALDRVVPGHGIAD
jgi:hypothetical protein